jgi:hypothetical protein
VILFAVTGILFVVLGAAAFIWSGWVIVSGPQGDGTFAPLIAAGVGRLGVLLGPVAFLLGLISLWLTRGLVRARDSLKGASTRAGWLVAVIVALVLD